MVVAANRPRHQYPCCSNLGCPWWATLLMSQQTEKEHRYM